MQEVADSFGQIFENVVVLGIGGSGLGAVTLRDALLPPLWNERSEEQRDWFPRLYVLDNPDAATVGPLLDRLDLRRTLFNVVSKSGSTAETMALYLVIRERLTRLVDGVEKKIRVPVEDIGIGREKNFSLLPGDIVFVPESFF